MRRSDRVTIICVIVNGRREIAPGQIVIGGQGPMLFSSDRMLADAGGGQRIAALMTDAVWYLVDESPLRLARQVAMRLGDHWQRNRDVIRVIPMSDAAAGSLTGVSGSLPHLDSVAVAGNELLVVMISGDECEPCSFHGKYRQTAAGWERAHAASYAPQVPTRTRLAKRRE